MRAIVIVALWLVAAGQAVVAHDHGAQSARRHAHHKLHKKFAHTSAAEIGIAKRGKQCQFPKGEGMVEVAPEGMNAGWAMSPDQACKPGMYCPYACEPGQLMAQWNPKATTYSYPQSMEGGLYCNKNGEIEKPFPNKPYCYDGHATVQCKNKAPKPVAFCQTVLPGNEAMLIPTSVDNDAVLAVPGEEYWAKTSAHYYINPPGISPKEGCVWGTKEKAVGNWAAYVAGANQVGDGETFVTLGWNPIYIEPDVPFRDEVPNYGVKIECDGNCNGLPCEIDPSKHGVNEVSQKNLPGAGGAHFCVVGVPKGSKATIVVFNKDGSDQDEVDVKNTNKGSDNESAGDDDEEEIPEEKPSSSYVSQSKTTAVPESKTVSSSATSSSTSTTSEEVSSTTSSPTTSSPTTSSQTTSSQTTSSQTTSSQTTSSQGPKSTSSHSHHESKAPSTTFSTSKLSDVASVTGSSQFPTATSNGTVPTSPSSPTPEETPSSATATAFPSLTLLMVLAYAVMLL